MSQQKKDLHLSPDRKKSILKKPSKVSDTAESKEPLIKKPSDPVS